MADTTAGRTARPFDDGTRRFTPEIDAGNGRPRRGWRQNAQLALRLEETARLLEEQGGDRFRVRAYRAAATTLRHLDRPASAILDASGLEGLERLPTIGTGIARGIRQMVRTGRYPMLERLRGASDPVSLLAGVPGIGPVLAERIHEQLGVETLEELETAAHDGRLKGVRGLGARRIAGIVDTLASRLERVRPRGSRAPESGQAGVAELLDVDREYRRKVRTGALPKIAPRRFNPAREAWLPILHTTRGTRHYTALFSNTPRAHRLNRTADWVVLYWDGDGGAERQCTVVTGYQGRLKGKRVVRGREIECLEYYGGPEGPAGSRRSHAQRSYQA
ncbi:MAG: helix-hairpin-helix domain-containing protein [Gemmatimonadales bacterium]